MINFALRHVRDVFRPTDEELKEQAIEEFISDFSSNNFSYHAYKNSRCATHLSDIHSDCITHPSSSELASEYTLAYVPLVDINFKLEKQLNKYTWNIVWVDGIVKTPSGEKEKIGLGIKKDLETLAEYVGTNSIEDMKGYRIPVVISTNNDGSVDMCMYELGIIKKELSGERMLQRTIVAEESDENNPALIS